MLGFSPGLYFRFCWAFVGPLFLAVKSPKNAFSIKITEISVFSQYNVVYGFISYEPIVVQGYTFPRWVYVLGWIISFSSASMIPIVGLYQLYKSPGLTLKQVHNLVATIPSFET